MSENKETKVINKIVPGKGGDVLTILQGKAPSPIESQEVKRSGRIDAAGNFFEKRIDVGQFEKKDCVLFANYDERTVVLEIFPQFAPKMVKISGKLFLDSQLERFGINNPDTKYNRDELAQLFKFNRNAFSMISEGTGFVRNLKDFHLKFDQAFQDTDNQRGSKKVVVERVINECNLPDSITLNLPVFKGSDKSRIVVDVLFDVSAVGDVIFYLESADLADLIEEKTIELIDEQVKRFDGVAIIYR